MTERSESEILSGAPIRVVLGEREFHIAPQVRKWSRRFRSALGAALTDLDLVTFATQAAVTGNVMQVDVAQILPLVLSFVREKADQLLDLIYEYSPALQEAREYIEENATDEQCVEALVACFRMAFGPFVRIQQKVQMVASPRPESGPSPEATK